jgi:hypothetical protein
MSFENDNPNIRKGKFIWMDDGGRKRYIENLMQKITDGYYFSEKVLSRIVEELAPTFNEAIEHE